MQQIINILSGTGSGDTTACLYNAANRLIAAERDGTTEQPIYNGVNDRVGQTIGVTTTHFALDVQGLPEVIYTSDGESYLHLPGVIMTESSAGEVRYLLSDGLGSVRQAVDETAQVVAYYEFDPYGNPVNNIGGEPYGYTGEWYGGYTHLLHLRARWYAAETGTFLNKDSWMGSIIRPHTFGGYSYTYGNPANFRDPRDLTPVPITRMVIAQHLLSLLKRSVRMCCPRLDLIASDRLLPSKLNSLAKKGRLPKLVKERKKYRR